MILGRPKGYEAKKPKEIMEKKLREFEELREEIQSKLESLYETGWELKGDFQKTQISGFRWEVQNVEKS